MKNPRLFERIARETLLIETLEVRGWDHLDLHGVSVQDVKAALERAYGEGFKAGRKHATSS